MSRIAIVTALLLAPAMAVAQPGNSMGTNAYSQPHSPAGDMASGAAGTPTHKSHMKHAEKMRHSKKAMSAKHATKPGMPMTTHADDGSNAAMPH